MLAERPEVADPDIQINSEAPALSPGLLFEWSRHGVKRLISLLAYPAANGIAHLRLPCFCMLSFNGAMM
jgi:hypothetical protein